MDPGLPGPGQHAGVGGAARLLTQVTCRAFTYAAQANIVSVGFHRTRRADLQGLLHAQNERWKTTQPGDYRYGKATLRPSVRTHAASYKYA